MKIIVLKFPIFYANTIFLNHADQNRQRINHFWLWWEIEREREREIIEKSWTMRCVSDRRNRKAGWMLKKLIFILSLNKLFYMCYTKWEHSNFWMSYCCKYYQFDWVNNLKISKLYHKYVNTYIGLCYQQFEYTYNLFIIFRIQYNGYQWYISAKGSANQIAM